jgi:ferredoxin
MKRIELNREACMGSATCVAFAPTAFKLAGDGMAELLEGAQDVDPAALEEAILNCPTASIRLATETAERQVDPPV